ncbi:MAG: alpha/beta fold hydrolase, partial [Acidobacteriota bacterium]
FFRYDHPFERREIAELIWTASHQNILSFLEGVPERRKRTVRFEELVRAPEPAMRELSRFLGLEYTPEMTEPYRDRQRRMTDGIHEQAKMLGDVKFHTHRRIDSSAADRWRETYTEDFLGGPARRVARTLGYRDVAETPAPPRRLPRCLAALRPGAEGSPRQPALFLVHAVFGDTYFFRHLAARLAPGRPVYGLRALGMEAGEEPLSRIEEMAALYVDSIRQVQPEGPYHLVGSSMGGVVAYEMARQLAADGRRVGLLGLLDTGEPGEAPAPDDRVLFEIEALDHLVGETDPEAVELLRSLDSREERLAHILKAAKSAGALPASFDLDRLRRLMDVVNANGQAMVRYRPQSHGGGLVHFRAAATAQRLERPEATGWAELCRGEVEVEVIPGDHMSIHFPPHAEHLAGSLDQRMASTEEASPERPALSMNRPG